MQHSSLVIALILAGGSGHRVHGPVPKQYVEVGGQSILQHTLRAFSGHVDRLLVVCQEQYSEQVRQIEPAAMLAPAGATGFESLCQGVAALSGMPDDTLVMIHDAVRPLVTSDVILQNLAVARRLGNAIASVEVYETLLCVPGEDGIVRSMTRREGMYRAQTPQTFTLATLRKMISEARRLCIADAQSACVLAQQLGYELHVSPGDLRNFKITTPSDIRLLEQFFASAK